MIRKGLRPYTHHSSVSQQGGLGGKHCSSQLTDEVDLLLITRGNPRDRQYSCQLMPQPQVSCSLGDSQEVSEVCKWQGEGKGRQGN